MDPAEISVCAVPSAAEIEGRPLCLTILTYGDDGPAVAVFWWDDEPLHDRDVRFDQGDGTLADGTVTPDHNLSECGWFWWQVGDEAPWHHDPRVSVAKVQSIGNVGTPGDVVRALRQLLEAEAEPTWSQEQSLEMIVRKLPFWPAGEEEAAVIEGDASIGSVVVDEDDLT